MKKKIFITCLISGLAFSCTPVYASLDEVNNFLAEYSSDSVSFYTEEFSNENYNYTKEFDNSKRKTLFVRVAISDSAYDLVEQEDEIFAELAKQDWFDYASISCITFASDPGIFVNLHNYYIENGTVSSYGTGGYIDAGKPWLIKTENELNSDTKKFLGRVAQELLQYNIDSVINLGIGTGGEDSLKISECGGVAEVSGTCEHDGKTYDFTTEFTYKSQSEWDGTYETIYVGANGIDLYGEYKEIKSIDLNQDK